MELRLLFMEELLRGKKGGREGGREGGKKGGGEGGKEGKKRRKMRNRRKEERKEGVMYKQKGKMEREEKKKNKL